MIKVLKFFSPTCGPCKVLQKNIKKAELEDVIKDVDITDDDNDELLDKYHIMNVPCLVKVQDDGSFEKKLGVLNVEQLKEFCNVEDK